MPREILLAVRVLLCRSEVEHDTFRSHRLSTLLNLFKNEIVTGFFSLKPQNQS